MLGLGQSLYTQSAVSKIRLLLDTYQEAAAAYSVRKLSQDYSGSCMMVERADNGLSTDIGFDKNGDLDTAAIATFCSGTTCGVRVWYDQSSNGNDAVQTTQANQPTIYTGGAVVLENGEPALDFDQTDSFSISSVTPLTTFAVAKINNYALINYVTFGSNGGYFLGGTLNASVDGLGFFHSSSGIVESIGGEDTNQHLGVWYYDGSKFQIAKDGGSFTNMTATTNLPLNTIGRDSTALSIDGTLQELVFYTSDQSTNRSGIETNINDYFGIYTPFTTGLLDDYGGAAAAYSLRRLSSTYTGSAIRVRRASDNAEQDIGFDIEGNLNTAALASFCSGTNGFVKTWYCQSGNANDATQTTTSEQPKIYDSSTGIIEEDGKPAIEFDGTNDGYSLDTSSLDIGSLSSFTVGKYNDTAGSQVMLALSGSNSQRRWYAPFLTGGNFAYGYSTSATAITTTADTNQNLHVMIAGATLGNAQAWLNSVSVGTTSRTSGASSNENGIANYEDVFFADCKIQEIIYYASDQSSDRADIETNINDYYNIYP